MNNIYLQRSESTSIFQCSSSASYTEPSPREFISFTTIFSFWGPDFPSTIETIEFIYGI